MGWVMSIRYRMRGVASSEIKKAADTQKNLPVRSIELDEHGGNEHDFVKVARGLVSDVSRNGGGGHHMELVRTAASGIG